MAAETVPSRCCCFDPDEWLIYPFGLQDAIKELHLKEGVLTGEECVEVYTSSSTSSVLSDSTLTLVLLLVATKSKEQCELATKILSKFLGIRYLYKKLPMLSVLSELYQCELITGGDVEEMKKLRDYLVGRIVLIQFCKETVTVDQTVTVMKKHDVHEPTCKLLKILSELYGSELITREEVERNMYLLEDQPLEGILVRIQYHKGADVVSKTANIMAKHGFPVKVLNVLSELCGSELITREEVEGNIHLLVHQPLDRTLARIQYHKGADVVSKTADIMAKHGFPVNYLKVLSELYDSKLITRQEVEEVVSIHLLEDQPLDRTLARIQYHKGADVVSKIADIMAKHGFPVNHLKGVISHMRRSRDSGRGLKSTPGFPINPLHAIHSNRKAVSQTATPNRLFHDSQWTPYGTNRRAASHTAPSFHDSQWTPHDLSFHDSQWTLYDAGSTLTSGYVSVATSTEEFPQLPESTSPTEKINPSSFKYPVIQQHYAPSPSKLVETKPSSLASHTVKQKHIPTSSKDPDPPRRGTPPVHTYGHESDLLKQCWIPFGIHSLLLTEEGGNFPLEPPSPVCRDDSNRTFRMEFPADAIRSETLEVRHGIILDGPFVLPSGYRFASPLVYVYFDESKVIKPLKIYIPHWIAGAKDHNEDNIVFVMAPHVVPEGERMYTFTAMESGRTSLHDTYGTVEVSGHNSLIGQAMEEEIPSCYCASSWEKIDGDIHYLRVAIVYCIPLWLKVLEEYWSNAWKCSTDEVRPAFEVTGESMKGKLRSSHGRGWQACLNQLAINTKFIAYEPYKTENLMESAVKVHLYPPCFLVKVLQTVSPSGNVVPSSVHLDIVGTTSEELCFSIKVDEEAVENAGSPSYNEQMSSLTLENTSLSSSSLQRPLFHDLRPSDIGLNKVLAVIPLWPSLAVNLGVPLDQVQAFQSNSLGGLLALKYWRDGKCGQGFSCTWKFLLQEIETTFRGKVAIDLERKASKEPTWSQ